jgi:hypothetical protein
VRLILPLPERCPRTDLDGGRTLVVLEGADPRPAITLTILHPRAIPMSLVEWSTEVTRADLLPGTTAWDNSCTVDRSRVGWQMTVFHTVLLRGKDPPPLEHRLTALYHFTPFQSFEAAVIARIHDPARFDAARSWIMDLLAGARPDWRGPEVAALAELYD